MQPTVRTRAKWLSPLLFVASTGVSLSVGALMLASHLPFRADQPALAHLAQTQTSPSAGSWQAVHILAAGCGCSRAVAEHLAARGPLTGLRENVLVVGLDREIKSLLAPAGFSIDSIPSEEAVARYQLHGAPWLVFIGPDSKVRYAGGYSAKRDGRDGYQDVRLWNALRSGGVAAALPAYGCAIGRQLQRSVDPLGLKYSSLGS